MPIKISLYEAYATINRLKTKKYFSCVGAKIVIK